MAYIAANTETVGQIVDQQIDFLLNGLFRQKQVSKDVSQRVVALNTAQRHAIELVRQHLNEVFCADADTRLADVPTPSNIKVFR